MADVVDAQKQFAGGMLGEMVVEGFAVNKGREFRRLSRANWWFQQMREVVDKAIYEVNKPLASDGNITRNPNPCAGSEASDNGKTGELNLTNTTPPMPENGK